MAKDMQIKFNDESIWRIQAHPDLIHLMADEYAKEDEQNDGTPYAQGYLDYTTEAQNGILENLFDWIVDSKSWKDLAPYVEQLKSPEWNFHEEAWNNGGWDVVSTND